MLHVIIVGGGVAGLAAAISCRRAGHLCDVYEKSTMNNEVGAAINVPPNATRFLTAWGLDPALWCFVRSRRATYQNPFSLDTTVATLFTDGAASGIGGAELYYAHRVDLHNALKAMATSPGGVGVPVNIHLGAMVRAYDPEAPSVTLASGETVTGDVVIGADGVHSVASETVTGSKNVPVPPEHSNFAFRFLVPAHVLEADPETRFWNKDASGWTRLFPHNETKRRVVAYTCRDDRMHNFVGLFFEEENKGQNDEDWQAGVGVDQVLAKYADFDPRLLKVMSKATEVKRWPLLYRHPLSTYRRGKMALAGDAAHPMLPHQGQGGAQGLEDGLVLGMVLHGASMATAGDIEERLAVYDAIRRNRASVVQILSNVGQDQCHLVREELSKYLPEDKIPNNPAEVLKHNFGYDVVRHTLRVMREHDPVFALPDDFFEGPVVGVPGDEPLEVNYATALSPVPIFDPVSASGPGAPPRDSVLRRLLRRILAAVGRVREKMRRGKPGLGRRSREKGPGFCSSDKEPAYCRV
ncbi:hypothetical protein N3K66_005233 [Trichothecium roseum]|uniref:Uncharacterized protein n=1 Tax=Trichothecium roseum TaxID=47278 RepID=A0ACC0V489_9HYPO|nr:hypothetical protein N3K66_005233 [Trichothecium roseum]